MTPVISSTTGVASTTVVTTTRTLFEEGWLNVKDPTYAATGDGGTDDRAAIQSALTAAGANGTVYFPPGTYVLNSTGPLSIARSGTQDVQTLSITGTPTGGSFTLTFGGKTTATIAFNASAATVQSALNALSSVIAQGQVQCTGGALPGTPVTIRFNNLGAQSVITTTDSLTGGTAPASAIAPTTTGTGSVSNRLRIQGSGLDQTTIKLSTTCKRAFDLVRSADFDVFRGIDVSDLTVDANSVASTANQHVLIGNLRDGNWDQRLNFQNITVRRCRTINVPAANTDDGSTTGSRQSVSIASKHLGTGEATQTYVKDVLVQDCEFGGGAGVALIGSGSNSGVNVFLDRLTIDGLKHDTGYVPSAPPGSVSHCAFQIGGTGFGGSCTVKRVRSYNSNDVGYEIDGMTYADVEDVITEDSWTCGSLLRNFGTPADASAQHYVIRNCHHRVININPPATSVTAGNSYGWFLSGSGAPTLGHVTLEDCSNLNKSVNFLVKGEGIACPELPLKHLTLRNFKAIHETINHSPGSTTDTTLVRYAPSTSNHLEVDGLHLSWAGTWGGTASSLRMATFEGAGPTTLTVNDPVFENSINAAGSTIYGLWFGKATGSADASIAGVVRRPRAQSWTTTATTKALGFVGSTALTIPSELRIQGFDGNTFPSATAVDALFGGTSNAAKVPFENGFSITTGSIASGGTVTLPVMGTYFPISGTQAITTLTASWSGRIVTLQFLGVLTFTDGSTLKLDGNFVTAADSTMTLVCDGTNWYELTRSTN